MVAAGGSGPKLDLGELGRPGEAITLHLTKRYVADHPEWPLRRTLLARQGSHPVGSSARCASHWCQALPWGRRLASMGGLVQIQRTRASASARNSRRLAPNTSNSSPIS